MQFLKASCPGKGKHFLACEIKAGKDKLSPEQTVFLERVKRSGGVALVIRTTEDLAGLPVALKTQTKEV